MALVRCTCVSRWRLAPSGGVVQEVEVLDPDCDYVVHRAGSAALDPVD